MGINVLNVLRPTAATLRRVADEAIEAVSAFLTHSPLAEQRRRSMNPDGTMRRREQGVTRSRWQRGS